MIPGSRRAVSIFATSDVGLLWIQNRTHLPILVKEREKSDSRENPLLCDYQLNDDESEDEEVNFS